MAKGMLNGLFNVSEKGICDSRLCKEFVSVMSYEEMVEKLNNEERAVVLLSTHRVVLFQELYDKLLRDGVHGEKIIALYEDEEVVGIRKIAENIEDDKKIVAKSLLEEPYQLKNGLRMFLPYYKRGDYIQEYIHDAESFYEQDELNYVFDEFQDGMIKKRLSGKVALDIGANIGNHALFMLKYCGALCVHCFEPVEPTFQILENNIAINGYQDRTCLHNVALGSREGNVKPIRYKKRNVGGTPLMIDKKGDLRMTSLDAFEIDSIAFIKIDVEGMEMDVLQGAKKTIERFKPFVFIESFGENFYKVQEYFAEYGYEYETIGTQGNYLFWERRVAIS